MALRQLALIALALVPSGLSLPLTTRQNAQKLVIAHHIVGVTFPYTLSDWEADVKLASANGIDGFALNVGGDSYTTTQVTNAFQAASTTNPNFKLFFSFDMSSIPCVTAQDAKFILDLTRNFAQKPNYLQLRGAPYVTTFSGESCTFGVGGDGLGDNTVLDTIWQKGLKDQLNFPIHFAPGFLINPARYANLTVTDGDNNFRGGFSDVLNGDPQSVAAARADITSALQSDPPHLDMIKATGKSYMTAVSPWFFTHFSKQSFDKNFMFLMDGSAFTSRWQQILSFRDQTDIAQIVAWNDYGQSNYINAIRGDVPAEAKSWVDGFDHRGWLKIVKHFSEAFKTGAEPVITQDSIVLQARPHIRDAKAPADKLGIPPFGFESTEDKFFGTVFATAPGKITLSSAPDSSDAVTTDIPAGVSKIVHPLVVGGNMKAVLTRDDKEVVNLKPDGFTFTATPQVFNYNAFVAASA